MYFSDYHVHSHFSDDCSESMEAMVKKAIELGLRELAFTDHVDFDYPDPNFPFLIDYDRYTEEFNAIKERYRGSIELLLGVEIGMQPHVYSDIEALVSKYPFDFIIGSVHAADRMDFCSPDFFIGKTQYESYMRYFENVLENVKLYSSMFDVLGHKDLIVRYGGFDSTDVDWLYFDEIIDEILKFLIQNGRGIELNTSGFRYGLERPHPHPYILERYKSLGGEIITLGSDAHTAGHICADFDFAYSMLKEYGFKSICSFRSRKHSFIEIP